MISDSLLSAFWEQVNQDTGRFCWGWHGHRNDGGYATVGGKLAHRVSWEIHNGEIPEGKMICHYCHNPPCTNPDHLHVGDHYINAVDRKMKHLTVYRKKSPSQQQTLSAWQKEWGKKRPERELMISLFFVKRPKDNFLTQLLECSDQFLKVVKTAKKDKVKKKKNWIDKKVLRFDENGKLVPNN